MKISRYVGLLFGRLQAQGAVSTGFSTEDPLFKVGPSVWRILPSFILLAAMVAPAAGQVTTPLPTVSTVPGAPLTREVPRLPAGYLIIQSVKINDSMVPAPATIATVMVMNLGPADIIFPAGSVLVRGDAAQQGGVFFPALTTSTEFAIAAGTSKTLMLSVGDVCAAGNPGLVTFLVDPAKVIWETNDENDGMSVQVSP